MRRVASFCSCFFLLLKIRKSFQFFFLGTRYLLAIKSAGPGTMAPWLPYKPTMDLTQFLKTESPLQMMKNSFYFMLKALFGLKIFTFLIWLFGPVRRRPDKKVKVNCKIYDVTERTVNNYYIHVVQYLKKWRQWSDEISLVNTI